MIQTTMLLNLINNWNFTTSVREVVSEMPYYLVKSTFIHDMMNVFHHWMDKIPPHFLEVKLYMETLISWKSFIQSPDRIASVILKYYHYLPLTPLVFWLYPLLFTVLFTLVILPIITASTWLFWIITSLTLGVIQVLYALYQFGMIGIDLVVLSVLKTFALIRSWILSPYYMAYTASTHHHHSNTAGQYTRKPYQGRRRQWRDTLAQAKNYTDFLMVDILEPAEDARKLSLLHHSHQRSTIQYFIQVWSYIRQYLHRLIVLVVSPLRWLWMGLVHGIRPSQHHLTRKTSIPIQESLSTTTSSKSPRRTKSCMEFLLKPLQVEPLLTTTSSDTNTRMDSSSISTSCSSRCSTNILIPTLVRSSSACQDMNRSTTITSSNTSLQSTSSGSNNMNNNNSENELGMIGSMLHATTQRLEEARIQTQQQMAIQGSINDSKEVSINSSKEEEEDVSDGYRSRTVSAKNHPCNNNASEWNTPVETGNNITHNVSSSILTHIDDDHDQENHKDTTSTNTSSPDLSILKYLLTGIVKRNHLNVEKTLVDDAQLVAEYGRHRLSKEARDVIQGYYHEVQSCLEFIADGDVMIPPQKAVSIETALPTVTSSITQPVSPNVKEEEDTVITSGYISDQHVELYDRIHLMRKMRHNVGRTALMLSGGGAQAMYHLGTIKALCESGLYNDITVISGTSGGSITAAMCAIKTQEELLNDVCVTHVSTDYMLNGEMKKKNVRWFPRVVDMGWFWLQHGLLVDSKEFKRCCDFYFSDITFEEAFERTGKHVCITVSASRAGDSSTGGDGSQRLLLNHISTPHVTIASAVACSCALPGVMSPGKLITKNTSNEQAFFEVDGVEWIDGSVQADLPFKRISTLFNVSNYIVCQTNFHVVPFLHKPHHPSIKSWYWQIFQLCEWDIRSRALNLSRLGLFPKIFGQDISKVFKQKYHGDLTIVPRFTTMQVFGLKALINPTVEDMEVYIQNGQAATWPYISVIREMLRIESTIDRCIAQLTERVRLLSPTVETINMNDDVDSVTSADAASYSLASSYRIGGGVHHRHSVHVVKETETLKSKVKSLEQENIELRKKLELLLLQQQQQ